MKKSFTLIEVIVSITLFAIMMVFLIQTIDIFNRYNKTYENELFKIIDSSDLQKIVFEDIAEAKAITSIKPDDDKNSVVKLISNNTYHNSFSTNITYFLSKNRYLVRIESKLPFELKSLKSDFYDDPNTYVDFLASDIEKFVVLPHQGQNNKNFTFYIKPKDKQQTIFCVKKFADDL